MAHAPLRILILNGPNLNRLGKRQPEIYGSNTLGDLESELKTSFQTVQFEFFQSNHEGELIDKIHKADVHGIIFNPGAYTHTSIALMDAISSIEIPVIEVHLSNIHSREDFRQVSYIAKVSLGQISGFGFKGYHLAVNALHHHLTID